MGQPIILSHTRAPGDITVMTAFVRDFAKQYPQYAVEVFTSCPSLWENNPHVSKVLSGPREGIPFHELGYGKQINEADAIPLHFLSAFYRDFRNRTSIDVEMLEPKPDLHLSEYELTTRPIEGRYWCVVAGGKSDFTCKIWSTAKFQQTINVLRQFGLRFVQMGATYRANWHPTLDGVLNLVGKTNLRDCLWLLHHSEGIICPVTFFMHAAAALDKPCVCVAGGREHWWWEAYVNSPTVQNFGPASGKVPVPHRYLHTQTLLDCCKSRGCWMNKVSRTEQDKNKMYCKKPTDDGYGQQLPLCMDMITVEHVVAAVMSYYEDGTLEPIGDPPKIVMPNGEPLNVKSLTATGTPKIEPRSVAHIAPGQQAPPPLVDLFAPADQIQPLAPLPPKVAVEDPIPKLTQPTREQNKFLEGKNKDGQRVIMEDPFDHKTIGGKLTVCILMYGNHHDLHRRCLNSVLSTIPAPRRDVRVCCNEVCPQTLEYLDRLKRQNAITMVYVNQINKKKYPAMREMLRDADNPINTKYLVWFDDDSIADRDPQWAHKLVQTIVNHHDDGCRIYGATYVWTFSPAQIDWIKTRPWYKGRPLQLHNGTEAANGNKVTFPAGGFWAMSTDMIQAADIPDEQIGNNGGDYMVMEQIYQQGFKMKHWNGQKQFIHTSSVKRRGLSEKHTGEPGWVPGGNT